MITPRQAKEVLGIGDVVYIAAGRNIREAHVLAVEPLGINTDMDFLPYEEHLGRWWLTKSVAKSESRKET